MFKIYNYEEIRKNKRKFDEIFSYIRKYGSHTMSYSTLQPKMNYFLIPNIGFICYAKYKKHSKTRYVLGDPICDKNNVRYLIDKFLKNTKSACFLQISTNTVKILYKYHGYYTNVLGTETIISINKNKIYDKNLDKKLTELSVLKAQLKNLENEKDKLYEKSNNKKSRKKFWKVKTKVHKYRDRIKLIEDDIKKLKETAYIKKFLNRTGLNFLRRQFSQGIRNNLEVKEYKNGKTFPKELLDISNEWINCNTVTGKEMGFLTKPFEPEYYNLEDKRLFILSYENSKMGFIELEPMFENDVIIGYYADIIRTKKDIPAGAVNYFLLKVMNIVFSDVEIFSLGLAPFNQVRPILNSYNNRIDNKISTSIFKNIFEYGEFLYKAKGQAFHKSKYGVPLQTSYYASKKKIPIKEIIDGFAINGLKISEQLF